jgi:uncharacterized protein
METVLICGGTGLVGRQLIKVLQEKGFAVALLSRKIKHTDSVKTYFWDPENSVIDHSAILSADYLIHLAGAGIGDRRWTKKRKQIIFDSRIKSAELLFNSIKSTNKKIKVFISASAVGYYGAVTSDRIFYENDPPAEDFTGNICRNWEITSQKFEKAGIRTVVMRTGIVLSQKGGALAKITFPVKMGIGSAIGSGKQYIPWIHIEDLCNIYVKAIEDSKIKGPYNAVAPEHRTNKDFIRTLAAVMHKPFWFPDIPAFILKILFGEMSVIMLEGSRVSSEKISAEGYIFKYPELESALNDLFRTH